MTDTVFLFPGQGSQYVGMGKQLFERYAVVQRMFADASQIVGRDLQALCFEGPEATLVQTDNVQPAITLVNLACLAALREEGVDARAAAGHSLGEYSALYAAGVFTLEDTLALVAFRGAAMREAADRHAGGMLAVFGLGLETLTGICGEVATVGSVEVANHNSPTQLILTGEKEALQRAGELAKKAGAKLIVPLKVSGPWHSRFMGEASDRMRQRLQQASIGSFSIPVMANVTGQPYEQDPAAVRETLALQMIRPVRWSDSVQSLRSQGHGTFVEVGPGKVLSGLVRDIDRSAKTLNVQDADTLSKALTALADSVAS